MAPRFARGNKTCGAEDLDQYLVILSHALDW
jgi:hypothetical protein